MAFVGGKLEVEKWLHNTAVESFSELGTLVASNNKIGTIALFNKTLYYRASSTEVLPLVTVSYLENIINNIDFTGDIINNQEFIDNIIASVLDSILSNNEFINSILNSILSKINVEVRSIKGRTLFFAFNPNNLNITPLPILPPSTGTCNNPDSVKLLGNFTPIAGSTENYDIEVVGSSNYLITYTVVGGVINTPIHETPIQVTWDLDYNGLSSVGVGVGCANDVINSKYDFKFFTIGEKISQESLDEVIQNNSFRDSFKFGTTKQEALLNTQIIFRFFLGNFYGINDIMYSDSSLQIEAVTGYYLKNNEYYYVLDGIIKQIDSA